MFKIDCLKYRVFKDALGCFEGRTYVFDKANASKEYTVEASKKEMTTATLKFYEGCNSCAKLFTEKPNEKPKPKMVRILWSGNVLINAGGEFTAFLNPTSYNNNEFYFCE